MKRSLSLLFIVIVLGGILAYKYRGYIAYIHPNVDHAEIYIQAGHEGRTKGATGTQSSFGREIDWTPIVADEATKILREAGITVIRSKADHYRYSKVDLALSIHFDGCATQCATGASIGYDDPTDKPAADAWKEYYSTVFNFNWKPDNFTKNLSNYYNFKYTITKDAELVLELGDLTCPEQAKWLKEHLHDLGYHVAYFAADRIGKAHLLKKPNSV